MQQQWAQERDRQLLAERYLAAKEQAEQALEAKSRFLSAASHDLRQPLHALGLLETARQRNADGALAGVLDDAQACAQSLGTMCNDLLDLSRLENGTWELRAQVMDLRILLGDATRLFAAEARQRGLVLRWRVARGMDSLVRADEALLRQMVFNLLHNALRYTQRGGVLLAARVHGGAGASRSGIPAWALRPKTGPMSSHRTFARVPARRPGARPSLRPSTCPA